MKTLPAKWQPSFLGLNMLNRLGFMLIGVWLEYRVMPLHWALYYNNGVHAIEFIV